MFYRTNTPQDPREPGLIVNNLEEPIYLLPTPPASATPGVQVPAVGPNSIGVLLGNEPETQANYYNSISRLEQGFYLCAESGGCVATGSLAQPLDPFEKAQPAQNDPELANKLGDVVGNYKWTGTAAPGDANFPEQDKPFVCSGVNYCTALSELNAVDAAQKTVEKAFKDQYQYVETFNIDSSLDNAQDALAECFQAAFSEILAQEAQYQMCKTLADFCSGQRYLDYEEEEVEEGESFAAGLTLDAVVGDTQTIVKDVICQETEFGQNLQALRTCLQPGNRECRDRIANRIAGNLRRTSIQSVVREVPVVDVQDPAISFVTKRIQDNPTLAQSVIDPNKFSVGGYNLYVFRADRDKLIGENAEARQQGAILFERRPPGYDFSKLVSAASTGASNALFLPLRLPGKIYDWVTSTYEDPDATYFRQLANGFPFVKFIQTPGRTQVEFDQLSPNLLTLNKYPVMRSVDNLAREQGDQRAAADIQANNCKLQGRPVDSLQLFDSCAELRTASPDPYEDASTDGKAPFSRSLVYLVVRGDPTQAATQPVWPAEFGQGPPFMVAIYPRYQLQARGETQRGVSQSFLSRLLYPPTTGEVTGEPQPLVIQPGDVRRYAVQVTSCAYYHTGSDGSNAQSTIQLASFVENNCNIYQWPVTLLFPRSAQSELKVRINGQDIACRKPQSCIAISLEGNALHVATVAGISHGQPATSAGAAGSQVPLAELAKDLLRYYVDESYNSAKLQSVLRVAQDNGGCTLQADERNALLVCGPPAERFRAPLLISPTLLQPFAVPDTITASPVQVSINGAVLMLSNAQPFNTNLNRRLHAFLYSRAVSATAERPDIARLTPEGGATHQQSALTATNDGIALVSLYNTPEGSSDVVGLERVVGYQVIRSQASPVKGLFMLEMAAGNNLILTPFTGVRLTNVRKTKLIVTTTTSTPALQPTTTQEEVAASGNNFNFGNPDDPSNAMTQIDFDYGVPGEDDYTHFTIRFKAKDYEFRFKFGDRFASSLRQFEQSLGLLPQQQGDQVLRGEERSRALTQYNQRVAEYLRSSVGILCDGKDRLDRGVQMRFAYNVPLAQMIAGRAVPWGPPASEQFYVTSGSIRIPIEIQRCRAFLLGVPGFREEERALQFTQGIQPQEEQVGERKVNVVEFDFTQADESQPTQPAQPQQAAAQPGQYSFTFTVGNRFLSDVQERLNQGGATCESLRASSYASIYPEATCTNSRGSQTIVRSPEALDLFSCTDNSPVAPQSFTPFTSSLSFVPTTCTALFLARWQGRFQTFTTTGTINGQNVQFDFSNVEPTPPLPSQPPATTQQYTFKIDLGDTFATDAFLQVRTRDEDSDLTPYGGSNCRFVRATSYKSPRTATVSCSGTNVDAAPFQVGSFELFGCRVDLDNDNAVAATPFLQQHEFASGAGLQSCTATFFSKYNGACYQFTTPAQIDAQSKQASFTFTQANGQQYRGGDPTKCN